MKTGIYLNTQKSVKLKPFYFNLQGTSTHPFLILNPLQL